jgi:hypothetical protein
LLRPAQPIREGAQQIERFFLVTTRCAASCIARLQAIVRFTLSIGQSDADALCTEFFQPAVGHCLIGPLSYSQVPALAKRHKVEGKKDSASAQELLAKQVSTYDESELYKLLLEISLLDSAYQRSSASRDDVLMDAVKRYRVDAEKLQKAVAREFAAKRDKKARAKPKARNKTAA